MKYNYLTLLLCAAVNYACAQQRPVADTNTVNLNLRAPESGHTLNRYNFTAGFKLLSYESFPQILSQSSADKLHSSKFNGFILKLNDNQISYRLSGNFYKGDLEFTNGNTSSEVLNGKLTDNHVKIGFEKNLTYSVIQPYIGFDLGYKIEGVSRTVSIV